MSENCFYQQIKTPWFSKLKFSEKDLLSFSVEGALHSAPVQFGTPHHLVHYMICTCHSNMRERAKTQGSCTVCFQIHPIMRVLDLCYAIQICPCTHSVLGTLFQPLTELSWAGHLAEAVQEAAWDWFVIVHWAPLDPWDPKPHQFWQCLLMVKRERAFPNSLKFIEYVDGADERMSHGTFKI